MTQDNVDGDSVPFPLTNLLACIYNILIDYRSLKISIAPSMANRHESPLPLEFEFEIEPQSTNPELAGEYMGPSRQYQPIVLQLLLNNEGVRKFRDQSRNVRD